ncbi:MAG: helix-turn-helix domain-containing protein [Oscillospiraceae bacterium]|nr:helix-turn-helix domain-containing protein [Oscillospiraceae bacterium]
MKLDIGMTIRQCRKDRALTQEQLAEALGVTAGAVHKWESGLSMPEITMLVDIADFFEVSVDYLLGYTVENGSMESAIERINQLWSERKLEQAAREIEKALKKYPNNFDVVYYAAKTYFLLIGDDEKIALRCIELLERACTLFEQNTREDISLDDIRGAIATCYIGLKQYDKCIDMLKKLNADGSKNDMIGMVLAEYCNKPDEALPYLSAGIYGNVGPLIRCTIGFIKSYRLMGDFDKAGDIAEWSLNMLAGLHDSSVNSFMDRVEAVLLAALGDISCRSGKNEAARGCLRDARDKARKFDEAPDYRTAAGMKFYYLSQNDLSLDDLGDTAMLAIGNYIDKNACDETKEMWKEINNEKD